MAIKMDLDFQVCYGFMAYQPLLAILCLIFFYIYIKYMIWKHILYLHS